MAAGVYAARKKIKTLLIAEEFGGQSVVSDDIQNWIGTKSISGLELANNLEGHLKAQKDIDLLEGDRVIKIKKLGENHFKVATRDGKEYETERILLVSGSRRRRLDVPGGEEFDGKGVAYCATCDAPLFKNKVVAVVGGGNAGLESVIDLMPYASKIYLLEKNGHLRGDAVTKKKIEESDKVEIRFGVDIQEIVGKQFVSGLKYKDMNSGEDVELKLEGVFVEIGSVPNTDIVKKLVKLNKRDEVVVNHKTMQSSDSGIWSAGDASEVLYKQNNISAGDAIKAVLDIYDQITSQPTE